MDLSDFLLARITEDEAIAQSAAPRDTAWWPLAPTTVWGEDAPSWVILSGGKPILRTDPEYAGVNEVEHLTLWDPSRVLAECDARRRLVEESRQWPGDIRAGLELALSFLALPYAAHADYDEAWRP